MLIIFSFVGYILAYRLDGKYLSEKIFCLNNDIVTPAYQLMDNKDYVPFIFFKLWMIVESFLVLKSITAGHVVYRKETG